MSTAIWCELVCEKCSRATIGQYCFGATVPRTALKKAAAKEGWTFKKDEVFCDRCSKSEEVASE